MQAGNYAKRILRIVEQAQRTASVAGYDRGVRAAVAWLRKQADYVDEHSPILMSDGDRTTIKAALVGAAVSLEHALAELGGTR